QNDEVQAGGAGKAHRRQTSLRHAGVHRAADRRREQTLPRLDKQVGQRLTRACHTRATNFSLAPRLEPGVTRRQSIPITFRLDNLACSIFPICVHTPPMEHWLQNYDPLANAFLSTMVAALPVVVLLSAIAIFRIRIHFSALLGLIVALAVALFAYKMPLKAAAATTVYGAAYGLFPIGWIILNLIFLYQLTVKKGLFSVLRSSLASVAPDPRIQVILVAFSFGAFFEGAAGFGTPVAVTAAILIQLGFKPLQASGL